LRAEDQLVPDPNRARVRLTSAVLVVAAFAAYHNAFDAPFVFDDPLAIVENPTIRRLWPVSDVLFPPRGEGLSVEGRPVLNLTLAVNYALGGTAVRGYHVVNVLIHALATLTLFGLLRRTLLLPRLRDRFGRDALPLATLTALMWSLHPLQTESVTYIIQRAESLVGLFYLLTLYGFVRGLGTECDRVARHRTIPGGTSGPALPSKPWHLVGFLACLTGMATKEVMVSAPLLVLLFDRTFASGTFRAAWRTRWRMHTALFSTWVLLAALVLRTGTRGGTAGFGINVTPVAYALTQFEAVSRYIWLSFWPHPLIFDYGVDWVERVSDVLPYAAVLLVLIAAIIISWRRRPAAAWLGFLFFAVLSPTSSIVPGNRQTLAEHRMYLPLAAVITLVVGSTYAFVGGRREARACYVAGVAGALALGILTVRRNVDYRSELALYHDTAVKRPANGFARYNFGKALADANRHSEALTEYESALRLMGASPGVHYNLANSLAALGRNNEAVAQYRAALRESPGYGRAHFNLGNVLVELGRKQEAVAQFEAAVASEPGLVEARVNLGGVLLELGRLPEARQQLEQVLGTEPKHLLALFNLGNVNLLEQRWDDATRYFEAVVALRPDLAIARERLELARHRKTLR
jgi:tetratricopeptide (TPR) repeat protein